VSDNIPALSDALEEYISALVLAQAELSALKVMFHGEPGFGVPLRWFPFGVLHLHDINEATGEEGYGKSTGMRYYRYDGFLSVDVARSDVAQFDPGADRIYTLPSYADARTMTLVALRALMSWEDTIKTTDHVTSDDGKEQTVEVLTDSIRLANARREAATTNRGSFSFHIYTRRRD
jgi:hypothetical protein